MEKRDVVIVGCGMGGMATGLLLAHQGRDVLILEKNNVPGGRLSSYHHNGFTVDFGVHTISRGEKGPVGWCLDRVGLSGAVKFTTVRPEVRFKGQQFKFPRDLKTMVPEEDFNGLMRFLTETRSWSDEEIAKHDEETVEHLLNQYTENEIIHSCITRIGSIYCALPAWEESAGEFIRCLKWESEAHASGYPEGGCIAITNAFVDGIKKFGGEVRLGSPVEKIIVDNGVAKGVVVGGEEILADLVISNADLRFTMLNLVGVENLPADYVDRVSRIIYANSGPALKVGLDAKLTDLKMFSQFTDIPQKDYYAAIERGEVPEVMNLMFVCPSNFTPEVAPDGCALWTVATPVPTTISDEVADKLDAVMPERIMEGLDSIVPGYREHVLWTDMMTPRKMAKYAGERGATIGMAQMPGQIGDSRLKQETPIKHLYQVGAEAGGHGVGIELAINSAFELVDDYLK